MLGTARQAYTRNMSAIVYGKCQKPISFLTSFASHRLSTLRGESTFIHFVVVSLRLRVNLIGLYFLPPKAGSLSLLLSNHLCVYLFANGFVLDARSY